MISPNICPQRNGRQGTPEAHKSTVTKLRKSKTSSQEMQDRTTSHPLSRPPAGSDGLHRADVHHWTQPSMPCWSAHPGDQEAPVSQQTRSQVGSAASDRLLRHSPLERARAASQRGCSLGLVPTSTPTQGRTTKGISIWPHTIHQRRGERSENKALLCDRKGPGEWFPWGAGPCPAPCQELGAPWLELGPGPLPLTALGGDRDHC